MSTKQQSVAPSLEQIGFGSATQTVSSFAHWFQNSDWIVSRKDAQAKVSAQVAAGLLIAAGEEASPSSYANNTQVEDAASVASAMLRNVRSLASPNILVPITTPTT